MKFFHLSHTDLDGYGCQLITKKIYPNGCYFNANYGQEVKIALKTILHKIIQQKNEQIYFLITDLNLNLKESKDLDDEINKLNQDGYDIKLQLLDHHITGKSCADEYDWYYLDDSLCASQITYDFFRQKNKKILENNNLEEFIDCINSVDLWHENRDNFEFGKVLLRLIVQAKEINNTLFSDKNRDYRLYLLEKSISFMKLEKSHIKLDNEIFFLKKSYLMLDNIDDTLDNLSSKYLVYLLNDNQERFKVRYENYVGLLTYGFGNISIPANEFLKSNDSFDFFVDIGKSGSISMRSNDKLDVASLANKLTNGGGHINASGGKFENWKNIIEYNDVRKFLQDKLDILD